MREWRSLMCRMVSVRTSPATGSAASASSVANRVARRNQECIYRYCSGPAHDGGAPPGASLPAGCAQAGLNFTLTTDLGWIDLLGEVTGGGNYHDLLSHTVSS